jgi:hypothetical protein
VPEPTRQFGAHIMISPDSAEDSRMWPDPRASRDAQWKAWHAPDQVTPEEIRLLAQAAGAYGQIFEIPQRRFARIHSAVRHHVDATVRAARGMGATTTTDTGDAS